MEQPLLDIRVLDLSRVYAAPAGTMIIGDLGADVIRVESPQGTDSMREWGPFVNDESTYYLSANRNKRSITLNLKAEKGKEIFLELVEKADVVVENFKTGTMEKLGLGYDDLKTINDQLIMCSVTGFGHTGPARDEPGFDPVIQAMSGLMDVTGQEDGVATKVGIPIADILTSNYVAISILAAIRMRDMNHHGQHIDLSLLDVQASSLANISSGYLNAGKLSKRVGNRHNNVVPYQVFETADHPIMVCAGNNGLYKKFCKLLGHEEWATDLRYLTNDKRLENEAELVGGIQEILLTKGAERWLELLSASKIPAGRVNTVAQAFADPQVIARDMVEEIPHAKLGKVKMTRSPLRFSELNVKSNYPPPLLGEHNEEILINELGYTSKELDELRRGDVIAPDIFGKV